MAINCSLVVSLSWCQSCDRDLIGIRKFLSAGPKFTRPFSFLEGGTWGYPMCHTSPMTQLPPPKDWSHIERFLGLVSEYQCTNQIHAMWPACDFHVTPRHSCR